MKTAKITHDYVVRDVNGAGDIIDVVMVVEYEGSDYQILSATILGWPADAHRLRELSNDTDVMDTIQDRLDILNNKTRIGEYGNT